MNWLDALLIVSSTLVGVTFGYWLRGWRQDRRFSPRSRGGEPLPTREHPAVPQPASSQEIADRAARARSRGGATQQLPERDFPVREASSTRPSDGPSSPRSRADVVRSLSQATQQLPDAPRPRPSSVADNQGVRAVDPARRCDHAGGGLPGQGQVASATYPHSEPTSQGREVLVNGPNASQTLPVIASEHVRARDYLGSQVGNITFRLAGDRLMVCDDAGDSSLVVDDVQIPLGKVEVPWRSGSISSGVFTFTTDHATPDDQVTVRLLPETGLSVAVVSSWAVIAKDHATAVLAAQLFVPENLEPFGSWQERLQAYQAYSDSPLDAGLVWMEGDRIAVAGDLMQDVELCTGETGERLSPKKMPFTQRFADRSLSKLVLSWTGSEGTPARRIEVSRK